MIFTIIFIAIFFAFTVFFSNLPLDPTLNPFFSFCLYQLEIISSNFGIFLLGLVVLAVTLISQIKFDPKHTLGKKFLLSVVHVLQTLLIGFFLSYAVLLLLAFVELNVLSVLINNNPNLLGIITDKKKIVAEIKSNPISPQIIASDKNPEKLLVAIASATTGTTNFYGSSILSSVPGFLVLPIQKLAPSILIDNTIIITEINPSDLQTISPLVGYLFIKHYFPLRPIKYFPKISIMDETEFAKFRQQDNQDKIAQLSKNLTLIEDTISSVSASVAKNQATIAADKTAISDAYKQKDKQANSCYSLGSYDVNGVFQHTNTQDYCKNQVGYLDTTADTASKEIDDINKTLPIDVAQLATLKSYDTFFIAQKKAAEAQKQSNPAELGVFKPKDTIRLVLDNTDSHAIADYFENTVHEYLHYTSYIENKSFTILFFEEGLTEYFARQAITDNLDINTNMGYPIFVKIITQITKRIPETDLADIYFTKDEAKLETTLDRVYGENFYKDNALLFTSLQYASTPKQIIQYANAIMKKLNGPHLTEKDLMSTDSHL